MTPLESIICHNAEAKAAFAADCAECFGSIAGARLLATLCAVAHPLAHIPGMTDHQHGRAEVVALMWRYAAKDQTTLANREPAITP